MRANGSCTRFDLKSIPYSSFRNTATGTMPPTFLERPIRVKFVRAFFWCVLSLFSFASTAAAQEAGSIAGTVQDNTGGVLVGATVTITSAAGVSQTATSNEQGEYTIPGLAPGNYKVSISATGFKDFQKTDVVVAAGQPVRVDATLQPSSVTSSVNVEGQSISKIETENAQMVGNITEKELGKIGLNGRNFTQLITLAPGVSNQTGQDEAKVGVKGSVKYSVNGGRVEYNTFEVDGSDVLNASVNGSDSVLIVTPSLDALSDVQVLTSNYGAQYGRSASGTIIATTRSGASTFHGDAYYFNRNEAFNARNFFDQTKSAPLYRKNDMGFTIGGPLYIPGHYNEKKDKSFVFWSEEFRSEREPLNFNRAVPSVAERSGNFSDVCPFAGLGPGGGFQVDYKPSQFPDCPPEAISANAGFLTTYPGNQVPITPVAKALLDSGVIPMPNSSSGCNSSINSCYDFAPSPETYWRQELGRLDHNFSAKTKGTLRYIHDEWDTIVPTPQWGYVNNNYPTIQNRFYGPGLSVVARLSNTISNTLLNDLSFSYTAAHISLRDINGPGANFQRSPAEPAISTLGYIFNQASSDFGGKIPGIVIGGTNAAYGGAGFAVDPAYMPWKFANPNYSVREELGKVTAKHFFQFGVQYLRAQKNEINPPVGANTGDIQGLLFFTNQSGSGNFGNAFANFLTGSVHAYSQDSTQKKYYNRYQSWEPYFQDTWHVTPRLTLNLGVRVSLFGTYHEKYLNAYNWDPKAFDAALAANLSISPTGVLIDTTNPPGCHIPPSPIGPLCQPVPLDPNNLDPRITNGLVQCGKNGVPSACMTGHLFNPAPRIGFAWDPIGDGKTSIRAGYGIFFEHGTANEANTGSLEGSAPLVLNMTQFGPVAAPSGYDCIGNLHAACGPGGAYPLNVTSIQKKAVWPYAQQWSLSVQREFSRGYLATIAYVGSKGTHLATELNMNQLRPINPADNPFGIHDPITADTCTVQGGAYSFPNGVLIGPSDPRYPNLQESCFSLGKSGIQPNFYRTFAPGLGQIYYIANIADSRYNGLQATLRRTKGPLTVSGAYSYSHSLDDSSDRTDATFVNAFDLAGNKASSNFDQRHLLNISYIYDFSFRGLIRAFNWADDDPTNQLATRLGGAAGTSGKAGDDPNWRNGLLDGWELSGLITFQSGTPFTIINGGSSTGIAALDNAGVASGVGAGSYPDILGDPTAYPLSGVATAGSFGPLLGNPGAFVAPRGLTFGNAGRNSFNNPKRLNFDMSILKNFKIRESSSLEFRAEVFNIFNHTQFRVYDPNIGNTSNNTITCYGGPNNSAAGGTNADGSRTDCLTGNAFLHPVDAHRPRTVQFGLKLFF
jgi:hypothetical protein